MVRLRQARDFDMQDLFLHFLYYFSKISLIFPLSQQLEEIWLIRCI